MELYLTIIGLFYLFLVDEREIFFIYYKHSFSMLSCLSRCLRKFYDQSLLCKRNAESVHVLDATSRWTVNACHTEEQHRNIKKDQFTTIDDVLRTGSQQQGIGMTKKNQPTNKLAKGDEKSRNAANRGDRNVEKVFTKNDNSLTGFRSRRDAQISSRGAGLSNSKHKSRSRDRFNKRKYGASRPSSAGSRQYPIASKTASTTNEPMLSDQASMVGIQQKHGVDRGVGYGLVKL
uniref:Uncharacterized protein n=1 Tax=Romanomermis culicivorax TaxID=13658 RepID=A0A915HTT9_ROMCU